MQRIWTIGLCLGVVWGVANISFAQSVVSANSKIISATIYPDSALLTRSAQVEIEAGMQQIEFDNIIPEIDENTLTVSGSGTAGVKIHGALIKRDYVNEAPDERIKELTNKIQDLTDQISQENNKLQTILSQKDFLKSLQLYSGQQLPKELATKMPTTQELEGLLSFIGTQNTALDAQFHSINLKIRDLTKQRQTLENELAQLRQPSSQMKRSIVVNVEGLKKGTLTLNVSFLVHGVYWYPVYDARADFEGNKVELTNYGMVKQTTGEDWSDVSLALSTAKPSISGQMPYIAPWILRPYQPAPATVGRAMMKTAAMDQSVAGGLQYEPYYLETNYAVEREEKAEVAVSQVDFKGASVSYQMPGKVTVKSDGTEHKLPISTQMLNATFSYSTYPRVNSLAYLGTRVTNDKDLQLLAGAVNIFLDGDYVGKSNIQNVGPGEKFDLFLGIDESVKIERKQIEKNVDDVLIVGIASPNKKTTLKYRVSAENYKNKPINVIVYEAMPVSENDRIKVKIADVSLEPKEKDWNNRKGVWRWELLVEPRAKKEIGYSFVIEHPRDMQLEGM